jgi:voltage-gated potassium channel Kch
MAMKEQLKDHVIVCGYGIVGERIVDILIQKNVKVIVIDKNIDKVEILKRRGIDFILGDATSSKILKEAEIMNAKAIAIVFDDDAANLFAIITAKSLNPRILIVSRVNDELLKVKLEDAGANFVVTPNISASEELFEEIKKGS